MMTEYTSFKNDVPYLAAAIVGAVMLANYPLAYVGFLVGLAFIRFAVNRS